MQGCQKRPSRPSGRRIGFDYFASHSKCTRLNSKIVSCIYYTNELRKRPKRELAEVGLMKT